MRHLTHIRGGIDFDGTDSEDDINDESDRVRQPDTSENQTADIKVKSALVEKKVMTKLEEKDGNLRFSLSPGRALSSNKQGRLPRHACSRAFRTVDVLQVNV
jgi:hypothetical protein